MDERTAQMLKEWKDAEQRAREAELLLYRTYVDFMSGKGAAPPEQMKHDATKLRAEARAAYETAMAAVDRVLDEADRRSRDY